VIDLESRGYVPGGGLRSQYGEMFYLNIPKNASTRTTNLLSLAGWSHDTTNLFDTTIILLRDPLERWISGFATYASSYLLGYGYGSDHFVEDYNELTERIIFDNIRFDDHTELQSRFVDQVRGEKVYFKITKNKTDLVNKLSEFIQHDLNSYRVFDNDAELNYDTAHLTKFFRDRVSANHELASKIKQCYNKDYQLIETVKFYGT